MRSEIGAVVVAVSGLALFSFGVWLARRPAGYMVAGLFMALPAFFILYGKARMDGVQHP